jgi:hypothetical protein
MMRGAHHWAVAVRKPAGDIYVESHDIHSIAKRHPLLAKPFLRGIIVLGQSLAIGTRALLIATNQSMEEEEQLTSRQVGLALAVAMIAFMAIFVLGPTVLFAWVQGKVGGGLLTNILEGLFRVAIFVGYLWLIGRTKDIHRVFEYHGAEHKTIAAYEHGEPLDPDHVDRYSTVHVRCGTNFLIIVRSSRSSSSRFRNAGPGGGSVPGLGDPVIAGLAEALRLGADRDLQGQCTYGAGLWLQRSPRSRPTPGQIRWRSARSPRSCAGAGRRNLRLTP